MACKQICRTHRLHPVFVQMCLWFSSSHIPTSLVPLQLSLVCFHHCYCHNQAKIVLLSHLFSVSAKLIMISKLSMSSCTVCAITLRGNFTNRPSFISHCEQISIVVKQKILILSITMKKVSEMHSGDIFCLSTAFKYKIFLNILILTLSPRSRKILMFDRLWF